MDRYTGFKHNILAWKSQIRTAETQPKFTGSYKNKIYLCCSAFLIAKADGNDTTGTPEI